MHPTVVGLAWFEYVILVVIKKILPSLFPCFQFVIASSVGIVSQDRALFTKPRCSSLLPVETTTRRLVLDSRASTSCAFTVTRVVTTICISV